MQLQRVSLRFDYNNSPLIKTMKKTFLVGLLTLVAAISGQAQEKKNQNQPMKLVPIETNKITPEIRWIMEAIAEAGQPNFTKFISTGLVSFTILGTLLCVNDCCAKSKVLNSTLGAC